MTKVRIMYVAGDDPASPATDGKVVDSFDDASLVNGGVMLHDWPFHGTATVIPWHRIRLLEIDSGERGNPSPLAAVTTEAGP